MRFFVAPVVVALFAACGSPERRGGGDDMGEPDACVGLECRIVNCAMRNMPETSISGTVFAPNGTLALFGVTVYIPASPPGLLTDGVQCSKCQDELLGGSVASVQSDAAGKFTLTKVPSGINVPIVIQVGKWRRLVDVPEILPCQDNVLPANITSLPKNKSEGDLPKIAITTGLCDALECLVKKLGVDPREFTTEAGPGSIHLYNAGDTAGDAQGGADALADGTQLPLAESLWGDLGKMKRYDIAAFSCECDRHIAATPAMMANVKTYADLGGRVFLSHYNNMWISGNGTVAPQQAWPSVASCNDRVVLTTEVGTIDQVNNPKGGAFSTWMQNVMGSTSPGVFTINESRRSCTSVDSTKAERWVTIQAAQYPQNFQFTTPQEAPKDNRCGKVVMSDMHVASGSSSSGRFPSGCSASALSAQEKALAFMFFDIASCVGPIL